MIPNISDDQATMDTITAAFAEMPDGATGPFDECVILERTNPYYPGYSWLTLSLVAAVAVLLVVASAYLTQ